MAKVHRHGDSRVCGATTIVVNQSSVTVNGVLWAVEGDINTDGAGALIPVTGHTVTINGIEVIVHGPDDAEADDLCPIADGPHCLPKTAQGSPNVSCY